MFPRSLRRAAILPGMLSSLFEPRMAVRVPCSPAAYPSLPGSLCDCIWLPSCKICFPKLEGHPFFRARALSHSFLSSELLRCPLCGCFALPCFATLCFSNIIRGRNFVPFVVLHLQYLAQCFKLSSHSIIKNLASKLINTTYNKLINYLLTNEWIFS